MPISTTCPSCMALFRLPEELAGRTVKCQKCQNLFVVPTGDPQMVAKGASVLAAEDHMNPAAESAPAQGAPMSPEEIPVTARFADDDHAEPIEEDERPERPRPRRGERRPRRDERPKRQSAMLPILLTLMGLGLFACIGGSVLVAVRILAKQPQQPPMVVQKMPQGFRPRGGFKNGPVGANGIAGRAPNRTPTIELKLRPDGSVHVESELTLQDELNPDDKRHKHYVIQLEEGKRYQIDMKVPKTVIVNNRQMKQFDAYLYLIDDADKIVAENDDIEPPIGNKPGNQDSQIIYTAERTAIYKIEATFFDNLDGLELGPFILTVRELK